MFLIKDRRLGMDHYVFTQTDPRTEGYRGEIIEDDATLDYDMNAISLWPDGETRPDPQLGRNPRNPTHYKVFKFPHELDAAGFELVRSDAPFVAYSWSDYRKRYYPMPEEYAKSMTQDEWFEYLEEADFAAKIRKRLSQPNEPTKGSGRDQVADWVAKRHMGADGSIHQVWFLPKGAPDTEIRLLEVSERFTASNGTVRPIDFSLDVEGEKYKLLVADVSDEQLERIKANPSASLPNDWSIDDALVWDRRGRRK